MQKIQKLSTHEAQKIAAGEVVERPANVVKELVENAIDAGASTVKISLEDGGKKLIRCVDNGCGMSIEDARLSIVHHATSKITSVDDLESIATFGFRGEALSSICAVSKVTLTTKEIEAEHGTTLEVYESAIQKETQIACNAGTDLTVRNLFYNVPARQKFLKKTETELRQIILFFQSVVLCHRTIHFTLYVDGTIRYNCPPVDDIVNRASQIWENRAIQHVIETSHNTKNIAIHALFSDYQYGRYDRSNMFFFVNNRWIKNTTLAQAVIRGFQGALPDRKYPIGAFFITLPMHEVDVNIHPRKEDVLFLHPGRLQTALKGAIGIGIKHKLEQTSQQRLMPATNSYMQASTQTSLSQIVQPPTSLPPVIDPVPKILPTFITPFVLNNSNPINIIKPANSILPVKQQVIKQTKPTIIGQFNNTYILVEHDNTLILVDQHAAHERILYERYKQNFQESSLLQNAFPPVIDVKNEDLLTLMQHKIMLKKLGIHLEQSGPLQVIVRAQPVYTKNISMENVLNEAISILHETKEDVQEILFKRLTEKLRAMMACKAAIKAGDRLNNDQMIQVLDDLFATPHNMTCPHGRPTRWQLTKYDIERSFKRIS